jgi:hypothetical protein
LGPYQPGVTAPDPTDNTYAADVAKTSTKKDKKITDKAGAPEATKPLPGQDDPSQPRLVIPPAIQQLLQQLPGLPAVPNLNNVVGNLPAAGVSGGSQGGQENDKSADKLLDFLLSP